ncbi:ATP-binding protein [Candidatus Poriferisodalis sp.]|uniref:ATP-binding protein n=1 Tax=Candidatus Poriferisodalis sp. TaxID=3101277 RepID=UPI003B5C2503
MLQSIDRRIAANVLDRLRDEPVVALQGPRTVGKSTLLADIARRHGVQVIDLDQPAVRDAVSSDPATFVSGPAPVCIDEFQKAPVVLDAIKAELNRNLAPGRFVITGSTRFDALPTAAQALTGRIHIVDVLPFSQGEMTAHAEDFLTTALNDPDSLVSPIQSNSTRADYIDRLCAGGMPLAVARTPAGRRRWFDDYVRMSLERDIRDLTNVRHGELLPALLRRLAGQTAQVLNMARAGSAVGLKAATTETYTKLLEALFLIRRLPAWGRTLRARAGASPKVHVLDSGLAARLLGLTPERLVGPDPAARVEFGHLFETFVVGELLKQASWTEDIASVGHWRTHDGQEVDLVTERVDGSVVAFEVKAASRIERRDASGLRALRETLGDSFLAGVVVCTGEMSYRLEDRICVVPADRLWSA